MKIHEILEQHAVYDGKPNFMPGSLVVDVLNHNSYGGTEQDRMDALKSGDMQNPKRYLVRVTVEYEEVPF